MKIAILFSFLFSSFTWAADLSSVQSCLQKGYQQLQNRNAIVAAVLDAQDSQVLTFGQAKPDQLFEMGSITKTFTANLLAQAILAGKIKLDDPIPAAYQKEGSTITYRELATHTSGIISGNFPDYKSANPLLPYDGLTIPVFKDLYVKTPLANAPGTTWAYSNIGFSLLGLILAENEGQTYESLVQTQILNQLGMTGTYFEVPADQMSRFPEGHMIAAGVSTTIPHWDLFQTAIDPAGGLRSSITDMIKYARANLNPETSTLKDSITSEQQKLYLIRSMNKWIGLSWIVEPKQGLVWHNGETFGFNSILVLSKTKNIAVVAMTDTTVMKSDNSGFDTALQDVAFSCLNF